MIVVVHTERRHVSVCTNSWRACFDADMARIDDKCPIFTV